MMRIDPSDVMFAGAGALWGVMTVVRGVRAWQYRLTATGAIVAAACLGYLAWSLHMKGFRL